MYPHSICGVVASRAVLKGFGAWQGGDGHGEGGCEERGGEEVVGGWAGLEHQPGRWVEAGVPGGSGHGHEKPKQEWWQRTFPCRFLDLIRWVGAEWGALDQGGAAPVVTTLQFLGSSSPSAHPLPTPVTPPSAILPGTLTGEETGASVLQSILSSTFSAGHRATQ